MKLKPQIEHISDAGSPCGERRGHALCKQIRDNVDQQHEAHLDRELVYGIGNGYLVFALEVGGGELFRVLAASRGRAHEPALPPDIEHYHAHDAGADIARGGYGKAEAPAARKAVGLIHHAYIVRLTGALTVAHGQQEARRLEEALFDRERQQHGYHEPDEALHEIRADYRRARLGAYRRLGALALLRHAEAHGYKAQSDAVIDERIHKLYIEEILNAEALVEHYLHNEHHEACEHGDRHKAPADEGYAPSEQVGGEHEHRDKSELEYRAPYALGRVKDLIGSG